MSRPFVPTLLVGMLLALAPSASPALAADPLLSGYAGPGGGEQAVLGATLVPAGRGNGSLRAPAGAGAPAPSASAGTAVVPPAPAGTSAATTGGATSAAPSTVPASASAAPARPSAAPSAGDARPPAAGDDRAPATARDVPGGAGPGGTPSTSGAAVPSLAASRSSAGPLPLTRGQVLGALVALALLAACGAGTAALAGQTTRRRA